MHQSGLLLQQQYRRKHAGSMQEARRQHPSLPIKAESGTHTKNSTFLRSAHGCFLPASFCCIINGSQCSFLDWSPSNFNWTTSVTYKNGYQIRSQILSHYLTGITQLLKMLIKMHTYFFLFQFVVSLLEVNNNLVRLYLDTV